MVMMIHMAENSTRNSEDLGERTGRNYGKGRIGTYMAVNTYNEMDADPFADLIHWNLVFIVIPSVSVLGVVGNTLSLIVLAKQGFKKSSNILLFSLAVSDIVFMIGVNGPPKPMYEWGRGGFQYSKDMALVLYYLYHFFDSLNWGSGPTSLCIPVLITIERLIAVFMPLKFSSIVTPKRTIIAVVIPNVLFYGLQVYVRTWFQFSYIFDSKLNASVGVVERNSLYESQRQVNAIIEICFNSMIVLVILVGSGCIAIGIKVKIATIRRLKMTNYSQGNQTTKIDSGTSRTTKMLLSLCVFYTVVCTPISLPAIIPGIMVFPVFAEKPNFRSVGVFVYHVYKLIFCVNASCNFVIYVAMSKNFRDTLLKLLNMKQKKKKQCSSSSVINLSRASDM